MRNKLLIFAFFAAFIGCKDESAIGPSEGKGYMKLFAGQSAAEGKVIKNLPSGGFIVLGNNTDDNAAKVMRLDDFGNTLWSNEFTIDGDPFIGMSIAIMEGGTGYIVIGDRINSDNKRSMYIIKIDQNGKTIGNGAGIDASEMTDGITSYTGETHGIDVFINSSTTFLTLSLMDATSGSTNATITTERNISDLSITDNCARFKKQPNQVAPIKSLYQDLDNNIHFGAYVETASANFSNVAGIPNNCSTTTDSEFLYDLVDQIGDQTASQIIPFGIGFAIVGTTNKHGDDNTDIYFSIKNKEGVEIRTVVFDFDKAFSYEDPLAGQIDIDFTGIEEGMSIAATNDGGLIITGNTRVKTGPKLGNEDDAIMIKCDPFGNINWIRKFGDTNQESGVYVQQTSDRGYAMLTNVEYGGVDMIALIKTDKNGNLE